MIEASVRDGIEVSVITTKPDADIGLAGARLFSVPSLDSFISPSIIRGLSLKHLGFDPVSFMHSYRLFKKIRPDVVHIHRTVTLTLSPAMAARLLKIPVVATVYDYFNFCPKETLVDNEGGNCRHPDNADCVSCMGLSGIRGFLKKPFVKIRKRLFMSFLKNAVFHVLSQSSFEILRSYGIGKERISKILQVFPLKCREGASAVQRGLILYVGWIQERKGLHVLLKAMPEILRAYPDARIIAIGAVNRDAYFDIITKLIVDNGLSGHVSILGKKDYAEVSRYMHEAHVVAIPEQWENMSPVVLIEAMCFGRPVVASNIGGIPEFIVDGENGLLSAPSSPPDFAKKIVTILSDEDFARGLGEKARRHIVRLMDEQSIIAEYKKLYREVVDGRWRCAQALGSKR